MSLRLSERFFAVFGFVQVIGILAVWWPGLLAVYAVLWGVLAATLWDDYRKLLRPELLRARLKHPRTPRLGQTIQFELNLSGSQGETISADGARLSALAPKLDLFRFPRASVRLGESGAFHFPATACKLGFLTISSWPFVATSERRFFQRRFELEVEPSVLRILPEQAKISEQAFTELIKNQTLLRQGSRQQLRSREQELVHSIRKYQYPDPLRHIDQKKSARFGTPMTREFESLRSHHLIIALDTGRALAGQIRGSSKLDYYLSAALALAENAMRSHDEVSFFAFSRRVHSGIRRARGLAPFQSLYRSERVFAARDEESDYAMIPQELRRLTGSRSIVVVLTDHSRPSIQDDLLKALGPVCRKHLTCVIGLEDREVDLERSVLAFDAAASSNQGPWEKYSDLLYNYWLREKHDLFRERLVRLGGSSITVDDARWMVTVEKLYGLLRNSRLA